MNGGSAGSGSTQHLNSPEIRQGQTSSLTCSRATTDLEGFGLSQVGSGAEGSKDSHIQPCEREEEQACPHLISESTEDEKMTVFTKSYRTSDTIELSLRYS